MTKREIFYQEALFEVITTQSKYIYDLAVLDQHFLSNIKKFIPEIISQKKYHDMFSKIEPIITVTRKFFASLLRVWREDIMLKEIYDVVDEYFGMCSETYEKYAMNYRWMMAAIDAETHDNKKFGDLIEKLNSHSLAQRQQFSYYVYRPIQRVPQVPLLFRTVLKQTEPGSEEQKLCLKALNRTEEVCTLTRKWSVVDKLRVITIDIFLDDEKI